MHSQSLVRSCTASCKVPCVYLLATHIHSPTIHLPASAPSQGIHDSQKWHDLFQIMLRGQAWHADLEGQTPTASTGMYGVHRSVRKAGIIQEVLLSEGIERKQNPVKFFVMEENRRISVHHHVCPGSSITVVVCVGLTDTDCACCLQ